MELKELEIKQRALKRIALIFSLPPENIQMNWRFGYELKSTFRSYFRRNEIERIDDDIHDVADKETLRAFADGSVTISTVNEYCALMVHRSEEDTRKVMEVLDSAK